MRATFIPNSPDINIGGPASLVSNLRSWILKHSIDESRIAILVDSNFFKSRLGGQLVSALKGMTESVLCVEDHEPSINSVERIVDIFRTSLAPSAIITIGGGTTIDTGKLASLRLASPDWQIPSTFTIGIQEADKRIPLICCPTTVGPGAEVSPAAIFSANTTKIGVVDSNFMPDVVFAVPEFALSVPVHLRYCMLCDAIAHSLEGIMSINACAYSTAIHEKAIGLMLSCFSKRWGKSSLSLLYQGALLSSLATRISGVNIVHGIASVISRQTELRHCQAVTMSLKALLNTEIIKASICDYNKYSIISKWKYKLDLLLSLAHPPVVEIYDEGKVAEASRTLWNAQKKRISDSTMLKGDLAHREVVKLLNEHQKNAICYLDQTDSNTFATSHELPNTKSDKTSPLVLS